ncbi:MAG: hypothetical protein ACKOEC_04525 [Acidimicrobiia bacterium]
MLKRATVIQGSIAIVMVVGLLGFSTFAKWYEDWMREFGPGWKEKPWTFAADSFGAGRTWRDGDLQVFVRVKRRWGGDCDLGITTDEEVDRLSDVRLLDPEAKAMGDGRRARITDLFGRSRLYRISGPDGRPAIGEAFAVSYECDLVIALIAAPTDNEAERQRARLFVESNKVQVWVNKLLEGP